MKLWGAAAVGALYALATFAACKKKEPPGLPQPGDTFGTTENFVMVQDMKAFAADAGPSDSPTESHALVGVQGGAVEIWTHRVVGRTEILTRALDAEGNPRGPTRVFDGLEGTVPWLTAVRSGNHVWLAWVASTKAAKSAMFGFVDTEAKEAALAYKVPIENDDEAVGSVRVAPHGTDGGHAAFAAVTAKKEGMCGDIEAGTGCPTAQWSVLGYKSFDHKHRELHKSTLGGGPNVVVDALVDLGGAIFASASAWHGAPVVDFALAPLPGQDGGALPDVRAIVPSPPPRPPFSVAFTGDALVFRAPSQPWGEKKGKCPRPSFEHGLCEQIAIVPVTKSGAPSTLATSTSKAGDAGDAGTPATAWLPLTAVNEVCADGGLIIELVHPNGTVRLVDKPGAFVPELQGWTGRALLALDENGHVTKRACEGGKLAAPPAPPPSK